MRVEYKKSIMEKIKDAKTEAFKNCKIIEKIWLNKKEWEELNQYISKNIPIYNIRNCWIEEKFNKYNYIDLNGTMIVLEK